VAVCNSESPLRSCVVRRLVFCRVCGAPLSHGSRMRFKVCRVCDERKKGELLTHYTGGIVP
jgi:hypothetical protein